MCGTGCVNAADGVNATVPGKSPIVIGLCAVIRLKYLDHKARSRIASIYWIRGLVVIAVVILAVGLALDVNKKLA